MTHNVRLVREAARLCDALKGLDILMLECQGTKKYADTSNDNTSRVGQGLQGQDRGDVMGLWIDRCHSIHKPWLQPLGPMSRQN